MQDPARPAAAATGDPLRASASLRIRHEQAGGLPVIVLEGELDMATAPQLAAAIDAPRRREPVIVDLCVLDFMDSSGMRELLGAAATLGDGLLVVCARQGPVRRLFDVAGMDRVLRVFHSRDAALEAAGAASRLAG